MILRSQPWPASLLTGRGVTPSEASRKDFINKSISLSDLKNTFSTAYSSKIRRFNKKRSSYSHSHLTEKLQSQLALITCQNASTPRGGHNLRFQTYIPPLRPRCASQSSPARNTTTGRRSFRRGRTTTTTITTPGSAASPTTRTAHAPACTATDPACRARCMRSAPRGDMSERYKLCIVHKTG